MRCSTKYVGLDVHQATTFATVRDSSGKIIARSTLPTEEAALPELFRRNARRGARRLRGKARTRGGCTISSRCGRAPEELTHKIWREH